MPEISQEIPTRPSRTDRLTDWMDRNPIINYVLSKVVVGLMWFTPDLFIGDVGDGQSESVFD